MERRLDFHRACAGFSRSRSTRVSLTLTDFLFFCTQSNFRFCTENAIVAAEAILFICLEYCVIIRYRVLKYKRNQIFNLIEYSLSSNFYLSTCAVYTQVIFFFLPSQNLGCGSYARQYSISPLSINI